MKKIIRRKKTANQASSISAATLEPWRVLIVDDEPDIHAITRLALTGFTFADRPLLLEQALSAQEAKTLLHTHPDIAVAIIDVVMETDKAGLQLVDYIRNELHDHLMRIIIRTGQPGLAPEKTIIDRYDIDDYKEKSELTETKLYTTLRLALKAYQAFDSLNHHRDALKQILDAAPELYHPQSINHFFNGVLRQIISLCHLGKNSVISTVNSGFVATAENQTGFVIHAGTGHFEQDSDSAAAEEIKQACIACLAAQDNNKQRILSGAPLPENATLIRLQIDNSLSEQAESFIYLENTRCLLKDDVELLNIVAYQSASALKNLQLYLELKAAHHQTSQLLTMAEHARDVAESANSAKTIFLAKMSHELRTPLNAIIGYASLIEEEAVDLEHQEMLPDLHKIQNAGQQLLHMISDILDLTKIESEQIHLELEQFELRAFIADITTLLQPLIDKQDNTFKVIYDTMLGQFCSDKTKLKQILLNLLSNANKFTQRGDITLQINTNMHADTNVKQCDITQACCNLCDISGYIIFKVIDTGIGMNEADLQKVFDVFEQVDKTSATTDGTTPGAGLGLSISRQLCHILGGNITVESHLGKGSVFTLQMPINVSNHNQVGITNSKKMVCCS